MTSASLRAARAGAAVVDNVLQRYLRPGVANLGVGLAHWRVPDALAPPVVAADSAYGPTTGHAPLVDTLRQRLAAAGVEWRGRELMVTTGANQAFVHALMATTDPGDEVALFSPYYFSCARPRRKRPAPCASRAVDQRLAIPWQAPQLDPSGRRDAARPPHRCPRATMRRCAAHRAQPTA